MKTKDGDALFLRGSIYWHRGTVNGQQVRQSTKCSTKKDAEAWVKAFFTPVASSHNADEAMERIRTIKANAQSVRFYKAWDLFATKPRSYSSGDNQTSRNASQWADFSAWAESRGLKHLAQVTEEHAAEYLAELSDSGRFAETRAGLAPEALSNRTRNKYQMTLKAVFQAGMKAAALRENPFDLPKLKAVCEEREAFSLDELRQILGGVADSPLLRPLVIIAACTGLRTGDACQLTWEEIDLSRAVGFIRKKTSKTGQAVAVPVMPPLRRLLEEQERGEDAAFVFPDLASQYQRNAPKLSTDFAAVLDELGIKRAKAIKGRSRPHVFKDLHSFRHTFVYLAAEAGIPLAVVQGIVGHASPKMTAHYANHATERAKIDAVNKLPDFFGDSAAAILPSESQKIRAALALLDAATPSNAWQVVQKVRQALK